MIDLQRGPARLGHRGGVPISRPLLPASGLTPEGLTWDELLAQLGAA
jgi:hypothetical protein